MYAYCWESGLIEFGRSWPKGSMRIAKGPAKTLREFIDTRARHGYSTKRVKGRLQKIPGTETLLVPGIPEAEVTGVPKLKSLVRFLAWLGDDPPKGVTVYKAG
jgi:hypothetical protein